MKYDNLADARQKLIGTFAYFNGAAVYVRDIGQKETDDNSVQLYARASYLDGRSRTNITIMLDDPGFNFTKFDIGYLNYEGYALWYYRTPIRQYKQGLHRSQCHWRDSSKLVSPHDFDIFGANVFTAKMMESLYPTVQEAALMVETGAKKVAFHKDFALYQDKLRADFVIEYKGNPAAFGNVKELFKCSEDMKYLRESIQELNIKVA